MWIRKGKEARTEENYWTEKGRKKLREGKEPNKFMRRGKEGRKFKCVRKEESYDSGNDSKKIGVDGNWLGTRTDQTARKRGRKRERERKKTFTRP